MRLSDAAILLYDTTSRESFEMMKKWVIETRDASAENILITIVGSKADLIEQEKIDLMEGKKYAEEEKFGFKLISAKEGLGVVDLFIDIAKELNRRRKDDGGKMMERRVTLSKEEPVKREQNKKGCC